MSKCGFKGCVHPATHNPIMIVRPFGAAASQRLTMRLNLEYCQIHAQAVPAELILRQVRDTVEALSRKNFNQGVNWGSLQVRTEPLVK